MSTKEVLRAKQASAVINGRTIDVVALAFANKIQVSVWSKGKVGKILSVQLFPDVSTAAALDEGGENETTNEDASRHFLPLPHLNPVPLLGVGPNDVPARLYATLISSIISRQSPEDSRKVIVCLGVDIGPQGDSGVTQEHRKELLDVVKLVEECRVW
jgi:hypothetical protein